MWSDPDKEVSGWGENDRGVSFTFGPDIVNKFLQKHDLDLICRAHQVNIIHSLTHNMNYSWNAFNSSFGRHFNSLKNTLRFIVRKIKVTYKSSGCEADNNDIITLAGFAVPVNMITSLLSAVLTVFSSFLCSQIYHEKV